VKRDSFKKFIFIVSAIILMQVPSNCYADLLANGDFELGNLSSWAVTWNEANLNCAQSDPVPYWGDYFALCWYDGGREQSIAIDPSQNYQFSGAVYIPANGDASNWAVFMKIYWADAQGAKTSAFEATITSSDDLRGQWKTFSSSSLLPPSTTFSALVEFGVWQDNAEPANPCGFDAFIIEAKANGWDKDIVDQVNAVGLYSSIAIDLNGNAHISYYDETAQDLKYAVNQLGAWNIETVDSTDDIGKYSSIAVDSDGNVHIAYMSGTGRLKYAKKSGLWSIATITDTGSVNGYPSIALDAQGNPHISFYVNYWGILKYAKYDGSAWSFQNVDLSGYFGNGSVGTHSSLAIDADGNVHISYYDNTNKNLKYAKGVNGIWTSEIIDSDDDVGQYTSIALDSLGNPHISYYFNTGGDLRYAAFDGSTWSIETLDVQNNVGHYSSLEIDSLDNPHIAYYDYQAGDLKYARKINGIWLSELIDSDDDVGSYVCLALDTKGDPHMSYYKKFGGYDLKYITTTLEPNAPTGLLAIENGTSASLSWNANVESDIAGYQVYRSLVLGSGYQKVADTTNNSYLDTQIRGGNTYYYRVTAVDTDANISGYSYETILQSVQSAIASATEAAKKTEQCFIATAAYGTPLANEVISLCNFRDRVLLNIWKGRVFVATYYSYSPRIADWIRERETIKAITRVMLHPIVDIVRIFNKLNI